APQGWRAVFTDAVIMYTGIWSLHSGCVCVCVYACRRKSKRQREMYWIVPSLTLRYTNSSSNPSSPSRQTVRAIEMVRQDKQDRTERQRERERQKECGDQAWLPGFGDPPPLS